MWKKASLWRLCMLPEKNLFEAAAKRYLSAVTQKSIRAEEEKLVYARVTKEQVEYF